MKDTGFGDKFNIYLEQISRYRRLTPLGEIKLRALSILGDEKAGKDFINSNLGLVVWVAKKYYSLNVPIPYLVSEGNLALIGASKHWDPLRGIWFSAYAVQCIRRAIKNYLREDNGVIRLPANIAKGIEKLRQRCAEIGMPFNGNGRVSSRQMAEAVRMSIKEVSALRGAASIKILSLDSPEENGAHERNDCLVDRIPEKKAQIEPLEKDIAGQRVLNAAEIIKRVSDSRDGHRHGPAIQVDKYLHVLRWRIISILLGGEPLTDAELGRRAGVVRERIRQIKARLIKAIKEFYAAAKYEGPHEDKDGDGLSIVGAVTGPVRETPIAPGLGLKGRRNSNPLTSELIYRAARDNPYDSVEHKRLLYLSDALKYLEDYFAKAGRITGPPEGIIDSLTPKQVEDALQGTTKFCAQVVNRHIKLHKGNATEEEAALVHTRALCQIEKNWPLLHEGEEHDEFYHWLREHIKWTILSEGMPLLLFDDHADDCSFGDVCEIHAGNWAGMALQRGWVGKVCWVYPQAGLKAQDLKPIAERSAEEAASMRREFARITKYEIVTDNLQGLSTCLGKGPIVVSFDCDYFSRPAPHFNPEKSQREIEQEIKRIFDYLEAANFTIAAIDISRSPMHTHPNHAGIIQRSLRATFERLAESRRKISCPEGMVGSVTGPDQTIIALVGKLKQGLKDFTGKISSIREYIEKDNREEAQKILREAGQAYEAVQKSVSDECFPGGAVERPGLTNWRDLFGKHIFGTFWYAVGLGLEIVERYLAKFDKEVLLSDIDIINKCVERLNRECDALFTISQRGELGQISKYNKPLNSIYEGLAASGIVVSTPTQQDLSQAQLSTFFLWGGILLSGLIALGLLIYANIFSMQLNPWFLALAWLISAFVVPAIHEFGHVLGQGVFRVIILGAFNNKTPETIGIGFDILKTVPIIRHIPKSIRTDSTSSSRRVQRLTKLSGPLASATLAAAIYFFPLPLAIVFLIPLSMALLHIFADEYALFAWVTKIPTRKLAIAALIIISFFLCGCLILP